MDLIYELVFIFQQLSAQEVQHPRWGILEGRERNSPVVCSEQWEMEKSSGFYWGALMGPFAYLNPVGLNQDSTQLWGHPYVQEGEKSHFLPIFSSEDVSHQHLHPKTLSWPSNTAECFEASVLRAGLARGISYWAAGQGSRSLFTPEKCFLSCR